MRKKDIVHILRKAVVSHKKWVNDAYSLIEGLQLSETQVPINSTECSFGTWYYHDGQRLKNIPGFQEIEAEHDKLHRTYREIFIILFGLQSQNQSFFKKLFGTSAKQSQKNKVHALQLYKKLEHQSNLICQQLLLLENMIIVMSETQLARYLTKI